MKKRLFTTILIFFVCLTSVFCLESDLPKNLYGTYISLTKDWFMTFTYDKEMESFVFHKEEFGFDSDDSYFWDFYGEISKDYSEEDKYTLFCYNSNSNNEFGVIPMSFVFTPNGIKISMGKIGVISVEMEKISNDCLSYC